MKWVTPLQASAKDIQQLLDLKKENPEGWEPLKESNIYLNVRVTPAVTKGRRGSTTVHIPAVLLEAFATQYKKGTLLPVGGLYTAGLPSLFNFDIIYKSIVGDGGYTLCISISVSLLLQCV